MTPSKIERAEGGVPEWAIVRAMQEMGYSDPRQFAVDVIAADGVEYKAELAFARYIAEHEEEPVDPLLIEAREIVASQYEATGSRPRHLIDAARAGHGDDWFHTQCTLAALRRGIELAGEEK